MNHQRVTVDVLNFDLHSYANALESLIHILTILSVIDVHSNATTTAD